MSAKLILERELIARTQAWLKRVVIELNFCPFAKYEVDRNAIRYVVNDKPDLGEWLEHLILECGYLELHDEVETTLILYPTLDDFEQYLDFVELANSLLSKQNYEGVYQLATFHPEYCFEGELPSDPSNYTNRSPYPMLHIIRESSLEEAVERFPNVEAIPNRNMELARELGNDHMKALLASCLSK
ncbi:DUF1415 domain-containing protein [Alteromonas sp. a30]|uniref:DUF1415 domain-containing protein n=1 Tax=Alteromonas sp. a30 TaxID=2730917 RepID=UPI0022806EF9|nr:DUF1415 domain-containing protein [Alteromonas sp. a30]MCY7296338.1 DUF1415 domain-containing protein [Alteromonas sp. a30]